MSIEVVKKMYEALQEGRFLSLVSDDCQWDHRGPPGPPFNQIYVGPAALFPHEHCLARRDSEHLFRIIRLRRRDGGAFCPIF